MDEHFILEIENFLPESLCNEMIKRFENDPYKRQSKIGVGPDNSGGVIDLSRRNSKEIEVSGDPKWRDIDKILNEYVGKAVLLYSEEIKKRIKRVGEDPAFLLPYILGDKMEDNGYFLQRVEKDSWFRWHHDDTYDERIVNFIFYLNTIEEPDGGRTEFIHGRKITPKVGKLLIFPTTWTNIHSGSWTKKPKYMCVTSIFNRID